MQLAVKVLVSFTLLCGVLAHAQSQSLPPFNHVVIVIQENRTPDNLFGVATTAHSGDHGLGAWPLPPGTDLQLPSDAVQWCLGACFDPRHHNADWVTQYNNGQYGQSCAPPVATSFCKSSTNSMCNSQPTCTTNKDCQQLQGQSYLQVPLVANGNGCPQDTYVSSDYDAEDAQSPFYGQSPLIPYFSIASQYGFANYFFQTNQGPSQPAHDFLFGGTSAPAGLASDYYGAYYQYFASDNTQSNSKTGCDWSSGQTVPLISPAGPNGTFGPPEPPCFEHQTLADLLEAHGLKWQYYTNSFYDLWTAPSGIAHICWGVPYQGQTAGECTYSDFTSHVWEPAQNFLSDDFKGGGTNINAPPPGGGQRPVYCNLPNVAWIVPNGFWSDHPGVSTSHYDSTEFDLGPDWVAAIINSIGNATCVEPPGTPRNMGGMSPWNDTVIFVVWDDWGGWYDHVGAGLGVDYSTCWPNCGQQPPWGAGYTYGYRVPFLVVSEWTQGYVSGSCTQGQNGTCCGQPGPYQCTVNEPPYQHDFGSILAFIENNFNLPVGGINPGYPFADAYYPEQHASPPGLPLGDFFNLWQNGNGTPRPFGNGIAVAGPYPTNYFLNYQGPVTDPDNDVIDND